MDIIVTLLKELSSNLSTVDFVIIIGLILMSTFFLVSGILRLLGHKEGLWSFMRREEHEDVNLIEIRNVKSVLNSLVDYLQESSEKQLSLIIEKLNERTNANTADKAQLIELINSKIFEVSTSIGKMTGNLTLAINDVKNQVDTNALIDKASLEEIDGILQKNLTELNNIVVLLDRIGAYLHDSVPELKQSNKELLRDISDLSKDVALVERSLQTQINTVSAIKLRQ